MEKKEKIIKPNINVYNRVGIIVLSLLMAIILLIGWVLAFAIYRSSVDNLITIINSVIKDKGVNIDFTFQLLTIIIVVLIVMMLFISALPFIILGKQSPITFVLAIITVLIGCVIAFGTLAFYLFCGKEIINKYNFSGDNNISFWLLFLPWIVVVVLAVILSGYGLWLIIVQLIKKDKLDTTDKIEETVTTKTTATAETLLDNETINAKIVPEVVQENSEPVPSLQESEDSSLSPTEIPVAIDDEAEYNKPAVETTSLLVASPNSNIVNKTDNVTTPNKGYGINIVITNNSSPPPPSYTEPPVRSRPVHVVSNQLQENTPLPAVNMDEIIWTAEQIAEVWEKGAIVPNVNPHLYRKDYAGALMFKNSFLNSSKINDDIRSYNWTIVCQRPLSQGGTLDVSNLWPLNNTNALVKGDNYPRWETKITYNGKQNIVKKKMWKDK